MFKSVLIIAPDMQGLDHMPDIINAASGFAPKILSGTVTVQQVLDRITHGDYDILHFATHGTEHAFQVSDGIIETDMLEQAIRAKGTVHALILNACRSIHAAAEIYNNTNVAYVMGWPGDVGDKLAGEWAKHFYRALAMSCSLKEAAQTAAETLVRSHHVTPDELPVVLNGRVMQMMAEYNHLKQQMADPRVLRVPWWMILANMILLVLLLLNLLILTATH